MSFDETNLNKQSSRQVNPTLIKWGYSSTLIQEYEHWTVLLRGPQVTLGSLILASKSSATAFGDLQPTEFAQMGSVIADIESVLSEAFAYDKINYLMLMINDPNPHFHVIPRYESPREYLSRTFQDTYWPMPPDLGGKLELSAEELQTLRQELRSAWPTGG